MKDGTCKAGWAFAAAGAMEMSLALGLKKGYVDDDFDWKADLATNSSTNKYLIFSKQQLIDCVGKETLTLVDNTNTKKDETCGTGHPMAALQYAMDY
jgi:hypothetical protein